HSAIMVHSESMELSDQLSGSHSLTAPVHPPERDTGPPELHHLKGRYRRNGFTSFQIVSTRRRA
ncbi:MAG: hypothetical protein ACK55E_11770, partial [Cyanobacteriota bacterium]